jgi:hypothetical protein
VNEIEIGRADQEGRFNTRYIRLCRYQHRHFSPDAPQQSTVVGNCVRLCRAVDS